MMVQLVVCFRAATATVVATIHMNVFIHNVNTKKLALFYSCHVRFLDDLQAQLLSRTSRQWPLAANGPITTSCCSLLSDLIMKSCNCNRLFLLLVIFGYSYGVLLCLVIESPVMEDHIGAELCRSSVGCRVSIVYCLCFIFAWWW